MADSNEPPRGRFTRFRKLASLSAQLGTEVVTRGVKRLAGSEEDTFGKGAAEKLVATLGDLKGAAMKIGQAASMDPDLFSPEVRQILAKLQNQAPSMDFARVREVLEAELGSLDEHFAFVDETPLAAASLGQVHAARLKDGTEVVIKIQYPGIEEALQSDLGNLGLLVKAVSATSRVMDGRAYYEEMAREMTRELDYVREADLADVYRSASARFADLKIPAVFREHTTHKVITLERLPGITLKELLAKGMEAPNAQRFQVSASLIRAINGPFLEAGVVHGDPHPGNFMVMPDGRLGVLDFGSIKRFSDAFVEAHRGTFAQVVEGRPFDLLTHMREVGFTFNLGKDFTEAEALELVRELLHIIGRPLRSPDYDFSKDTVPLDVRKLFAQSPLKFMRIRPPAEAILFFRAFGGLGQNLKALGAQGDFGAVYRELSGGLAP